MASDSWAVVKRKKSQWDLNRKLREGMEQGRDFPDTSCRILVFSQIFVHTEDGKKEDKSQHSANLVGFPQASSCLP